MNVPTNILHTDIDENDCDISCTTCRVSGKDLAKQYAIEVPWIFCGGELCATCDECIRECKLPGLPKNFTKKVIAFTENPNKMICHHCKKQYSVDILPFTVICGPAEYENSFSRPVGFDRQYSGNPLNGIYSTAEGYYGSGIGRQSKLVISSDGKNWKEYGK
jgi:hypothetical protein